MLQHNIVISNLVDTAFCQNKDNDKWYGFDDSHVSETDASHVMVCNMYALGILTFNFRLRNECTHNALYKFACHLMILWIVCASLCYSNFLSPQELADLVRMLSLSNWGSNACVYVKQTVEYRGPHTHRLTDINFFPCRHQQLMCCSTVRETLERCANLSAWTKALRHSLWMCRMMPWRLRRQLTRKESREW